MVTRARALVTVIVAVVVLPSGLGVRSVMAEEIEVVLREGTNFAAAVSPADGSFILDLQGTLWRLPPEGGSAEALTDGLGDDRVPHFAPDGGRVVFQSYRSGTWDIWALDADGGNLTQLTESRFDDREPVFSPDGARVAFSSDRSGNYDVWLLDMETGSTTQLTTDEANDYMPAWTPSGDAVVFVSERSGTGTSLYRTRLVRTTALRNPWQLRASTGAWPRPPSVRTARGLRRACSTLARSVRMRWDPRRSRAGSSSYRLSAEKS